MTALCRHCRRPEGEHHVFEAGEAVRCVCVMRLAPVKVPCLEFRRHRKGYNFCDVCEHDEACHGGRDGT